ncbi:MAG: OB-fold nucleic acid binding domain-containing protein [Nanoarchaeota archaeon]
MVLTNTNSNTGEIKKRNVAFKLKIGDILRGQPITDPGNLDNSGNPRFKFLDLDHKEIIRVNIVANVVDKFSSEGEKQYSTLTIDDASGQLRLKMFGDDVLRFEAINPGDTVMVIGLCRFFNNEVYLSPEIITIKDPRYLLVRKLELEGTSSAALTTSTSQATNHNKEEVLAVKDQIIKMIKDAEEFGGIDAEKMIMTIKAPKEIIDQEIKKMLEEGLAYEPRPGKLRYLG